MKNQLKWAQNKCLHKYERWHGEDFARNYDILHCVKNCGHDIIVDHSELSPTDQLAKAIVADANETGPPWPPKTDYPVMDGEGK